MDNKLVAAFNEGYSDGKNKKESNISKFDKEYSEIGLEDFNGVIYHTSIEAYQAGYEMGQKSLGILDSQNDVIIDYE